MSNLPWGNSKNLTDEEFYKDIEDLIGFLKTTGKSNAPNILLTSVRGCW